MTTKATAKQRKALRSAAAKKGWETRTARERREIEAAAWVKFANHERQSTGRLTLQKVRLADRFMRASDVRVRESIPVPPKEMGAKPSEAEPVPNLAEDPNPWPGIFNWIKSRWAAVFG